MIYRIIKKFNLLILLSFSLFCSSYDGIKTKFFNESKDIDRPFSEYVDDFTDLTYPFYQKDALKTLKISEQTIKDGKIVGVCKIYTNQKVEIVVDSNFWKNSGSERREILMLHELTHCLCKVGHEHDEGEYEEDSLKDLRHGFLEDGCPASLMYPVVVPVECFQKHKDHYRYEVRLRCHASSEN